jgi:hypothetical protein
MAKTGAPSTSPAAPAQAQEMLAAKRAAQKKMLARLAGLEAIVEKVLARNAPAAKRQALADWVRTAKAANSSAANTAAAVAHLLPLL